MVSAKISGFPDQEFYDYDFDAENLDLIPSHLASRREINLINQILEVNHALTNGDLVKADQSSASLLITLNSGMTATELCKFAKKLALKIADEEQDFRQYQYDNLKEIMRVFFQPVAYDAPQWSKDIPPTVISGDHLTKSVQSVMRRNTLGCNSVKGIFKPRDGEPRLDCGQGGGCNREVAAHKLHSNLGIVPVTSLVSINNAFGSIQDFIKNSVPLLSVLKKGQINLPNADQESIKRDIQKIASLDICMLNGDRHDNNIMVQDGKRIWAIDHGMTLPSKDNFFLRFEWLYFKQVVGPACDEVREYWANFDIEVGANTLRDLQLSDVAINRYRIATLFLKKCLARNISLFDIGQFMITGPLKLEGKEMITQVDKKRKICLKMLSNAELKKLPYLERYTEKSYFEEYIIPIYELHGDEIGCMDLIIDELMSSRVIKS